MSCLRLSVVTACLFCVVPVASRAAQPPAAQPPSTALAVAPLAALPSGAAPAPAPVMSITGPAGPAGASRPAVPAVPPPASGGAPFTASPYAGVFVRTVPGSALRVVTPDELSRRGAFVPSPMVAGVQPGLAADEVILTCILPEAPPRVAAAPATGGKPARAAPSRKEGAR